MRIDTARFALREFEPADLADLQAYQTDPRYVALRAANEDPGPPPADLLARFIDWQSDSPRLRWQFALEDKAGGGRLIGSAGLRFETAGANEAEFGIELAPAQWGRHRAAIEICEALLDFGFGDLNVDAVIGVSTAGNDAVARLARYAGAVFAEQTKEEGSPGSRVVWRLTRRAWSSR